MPPAPPRRAAAGDETGVLNLDMTPMAPPTIDPLASPVEVEEEIEALTDVDEIPVLPDDVPAEHTPRPPPRKHRATKAESSPEAAQEITKETPAVQPAPQRKETPPQVEVSKPPAQAVAPAESATAAEAESAPEVPKPPEQRSPVPRPVPRPGGESRAPTPAAAPAPEAEAAPPEPEPPRDVPRVTPVAPVEAKRAPLPIPDPAQAATDEHFSAESLPTRLGARVDGAQAPVASTEEQHATLVKNAREQVETWEQQLKGKPEVRRAARLHYEAARLYESPLRELPSAAKHYDAAIKLVPDHIPSVRGARRVALQLERYQAALGSLDAETQLCSEPDQKALLLFERGRLLEGHLAKKGEAREAFEQAADLAPTDVSILKATAQAQEQAMAWEPLVRTLERLATALTQYPSQRAAYLSHMARVVSVRLKDVPRAIELYKAAMAVEPRAPGALRALKELLYRTHRWAELVTTLEKEAVLTQDTDARASAKFRLARVQVERLGDYDAGIVALEEASSLAPADETILSELSRLYEVSERHAELAATLERWLALQKAPRPEMLLRLAQLYDERLNAPEQAIDRYTRALLLEPGYLPASLALERLRSQRGEWRELVEMLSHQADGARNADERAGIHVRIAELCEQRLGSAEHAAAHYKRALEYQPGFAAAYKSLVRLYSQAHAWHELIEVYERRLEEDITDAERIATLFKVGRLEEDALDKPETAVQTYQRILDVESKHREGIEALQRAAERGGRFVELVEALEREAEIVEDRGAQLSLLFRAAEILGEHLGESERAVDKLGRVLERDPKYAPAIRLLAKLHFRDGRWQALLDTYQRELNIVPEGSQRSSLLFKMAELCERQMGDKEQAIGFYKKAIQADAGNLDASRGLRRLQTELGQYKEVAQLFEHEIKRTRDKAKLARLWFFTGELQENRLESVDRALDCYQKALDAVPEYRPAIDACTRLLEQKNNFNELRERLHQEAELSNDGLLSLEAAYREGEVLRDNLKQLVQAAEAFESVAQKEPRHAGALLSLERIYTQLEDRANLARLYEAESQALDGAEARVAAYRAWVQLLEMQDSNALEALKNAHLSVLSLVPSDVHTLLELERVALALSDTALIHQIDAKLAVAKLDRHSVAAYQTRLADTLDARGDAAALELYRVALSQDPENLAAARGISRIAERAGDPGLLAEAAENEAGLLQRPTDGARLLLLAANRFSAGGNADTAAEKLVRALQLDPHYLDAADALVGLLRGQGRDGFLIDALAHAAGAAKQQDKKAELWLRVAQLQHASSGDNGAAIAAAQRAVREQPSNPNLHMQLADYYLAGQNWKEAAGELQELLKHRPDPQLRLRALLTLGRVMSEQLERPAPAENHIKAALELDSDNREGLSLLLRIQLAQADDAAADTAARLVKVSANAQERAEALTHLGRLEGEHGNDKKAAGAFVEAVSILGASSTAAADFKDWLRARGKSADWKLYTDALSRFLQNHDISDEDRKAAHADLGRILDDRLNRPDAGVDELARALSLGPEDTELRTDLAKRLLKVGQVEGAAKHYHELANAEPLVASHWRALSACHERLMQMDAARWALGPLVFRGDATPEETRRYRDTPGRISALTASVMNADAFKAIERDAPVAGPAAELLGAMSPALPKLYPPPFEAYGVNKGDRITSRTSNSLRNMADKVALAVGVGEFELYVHQSKQPLVTVEFSDEVALFVNANISALTEAEQVFVLARAFANIARGLQAVDRLNQAELGGLLIGAARQQVPDFGSNLGDPRTLDALGRRITKAMPWFTGGRLDAAARGYASAQIDFPSWFENVHVTAARAAALVCDDLAGALTLLQRNGFSDALIQRVLQFAVSDPANQLRRRLFKS